TRRPRRPKGTGEFTDGLIVSVAADTFAPDRIEIGINHLAHERVERDLVAPAELRARFGRIAAQYVDLGRPEIAGIDLDQRAPGAALQTFFVAARAVPFDAPTHMRERLFDEFTHRMGFARRQHIIVGRVLL